MIQKILYAVGMVMVFMVAGCIPSLHPIYTQKNLVFIPDLEGTWSDGDDGGQWHFVKAVPGKAYTLVHTDDQGNKAKLKVHLAKIQGQLFMDCFPDSIEPEFKGRMNSFYMIHLLPVHTIMHVKQIRPTLQLRAANPDWLKTYLKHDPDAIAHEAIDGNTIVLTGSTKELQTFWLTHLNTANAFGSPSNLVKQ